MSANLVVDLGNTCLMQKSFPPVTGADGGLAATSGGAYSALSGVQIGEIVDMLNANTNTNVVITGVGFGSGPLLVGVQTSDSTTSGSFTDPTSGLAQLPGAFVSGGWLIIGSGPATATNLGIFGSGVSGSIIQSGFTAASHFQRPHRYARVITGSGFYDGVVHASLVANLKTTGSGTGFTYSPSSGSVNV